MRIGIIGTGSIGKTLALRLGAADHDVKVANSRGPETIPAELLASGARAVTASEATVDVDVIILSTPPTAIPEIAVLLKDLPPEAAVLDTSNHFPDRDGVIEEIQAGQVESLWVADQLGRPIVKAWNNILSDSFATRGVPAGTAGRIALPFAADRENDRRIAARLIEETGFDAFDAGPLAESWRQQPGTPAYCTDLTLSLLPAALKSADKRKSPQRRKALVAAVAEHVGDMTTDPDADFGVRLCRELLAPHLFPAAH